ncbi:YfbM family protein [Streptomyces sp. S1A]|uniref:DUF1877 family protein n=1 Tax=Streptomyces sp. ICN903 TaxID=2964654 RepID=UPI001EDB1E6F|nr:DUF1877 family protein [Streptomyces sp. ICN903]MCG3043983.1 YfbM family protein [Streptomyces sp. ICN903]
MALTQQLARVSEAYLARCRRAAGTGPDGDPGWDPPEGDMVDLGWGIWHLIRFCQGMGVEDEHIAVLRRSIDGDLGGDIAFLDHPGVYDGLTPPPALLAPAAVAEIAHALNRMGLDAVLDHLPANNTKAARACRLTGFTGDPRAYLTEHFSTLRAFYTTASRRGLAVVAWTD